jgi:ADP-ribosyl-[dinitrogen reductase] hydrolase
MNLSSAQLDRAVGAVLASAAGDALGSQYEFGPALSNDKKIEFGVGRFGHAVGEWTDDTSMAIPLLLALARGESLTDSAVLGRVVAEWLEWSRTSKDVGVQTAQVLRGLRGVTTEDAARASALAEHERSGRSAGNGSLMRTGPIALGYLNDGDEAALVEAATRVAQLTHWEDDNADACAIWCLAIRQAILTGKLDLRGQVKWIPAPRQARWEGLIEDALQPGVHPRDFAAQNGWIVRAFQAALAAIAGSTDAVDALERAIRGGGDTDTVAAIAGSLAGAVYGGTSVPPYWHIRLHGWPSMRAHDIQRLAVLAARGGDADGHDWPSAAREPAYDYSDELYVHPHDDGVWLGSIAALDQLRTEAPHVDAVVSLCRVGASQIPDGMTSVQVWLIDQPRKNLNLANTIDGAARAIADLRATGHTVFVHCAEARSRTAAVAALYGARYRGVPLDQSWRDIEATLPLFGPKPFLREAVEMLVGDSRQS